jgi:hypothetical protein
LPTDRIPKKSYGGFGTSRSTAPEIVRQLMIYAGKESEGLELVDVSRIIEEMPDLLKVSVSKHAALETDLDIWIFRPFGPMPHNFGKL